jgi:dihydrodipicolinate synthase/N-acetylneuraminate lyase
MPIRERRAIRGMAAVLLPFTETGDIDWRSFERLLTCVVDAGLVPAVNMDTGFGPVIGSPARARVLETIAARSGSFVAGVHVIDQPGAPFDGDEYRREMDLVANAGGTPIVFPSYGLAALPDDALVDAHQTFARNVDAFLGFELGAMFHPAGRIFTLDVFTALLGIPALVGLKHSSLDRAAEWARLAARDGHRPDFMLLTGNDRAIDMVIYGSDYLLGLATFAPDAFARRDDAWRRGETERFWALNDTLQYLGQFAFRDPVPAYRHDAAMFLAHRGWIACDRTHPSSPVRPESDRALLEQIARRLDDAMANEAGRGIVSPP